MNKAVLKLRTVYLVILLGFYFSSEEKLYIDKTRRHLGFSEVKISNNPIFKIGQG